ncbi:Luciferin 4-monooxygenase [Papilio xuthus]|uniref:Luciferin 4-monooxygenase n=1 Tax=Papilio xuthus TaxID=66420 RepID=A0A194PT28_PAPXU|nr:Luciferin 4-monooxygenase [Papilio xuthus]
MLRNSKYLFNPDENFVPSKLHLGDFFIKTFKKHGDKAALINGATDTTLTYNDILQASMNISVCLSELGLKKGETVGICSEPRLETWSVIVGAVCTGGVMTPLNVRYVKDELRHVMNISKPKILFCSKQAYDNHEAIFKSLVYIEKIILFGDERVEGTLLYEDLATITPNSMLKENVNYEDFEVVDVQGQIDTAFLMYSSGTTGLPKGVMQTHLSALIVFNLSCLLDPTHIVLNITPWYHAMGLMSTFIYLSHGCKHVFLPKYETDLYLKTIEKYKVNLLVLVPPVLMALIKTSSQYDLSSVRAIMSAAAALRKETIEAINEKFKNLKGICQGYGMTETTFVVTMDTLFTDGTCKPGSVGKVVPNTLIKIADVVTGEPLGPHQNGEVCVKSPLILKDYIGHDKNCCLDKDGFFRTGDVGYYDEEKYLFIADRLKELIKYKAYQVPPAEIEAVLLQHEGVRDVGVVGLPHPEAGELPVAFVVPQPGANPTAAELQQFVAERLSNPKHLRGGVHFVKEISKSASGKILRKHLRELAINLQ